MFKKIAAVVVGTGLAVSVLASPASAVTADTAPIKSSYCGYGTHHALTKTETYLRLYAPGSKYHLVKWDFYNPIQEDQIVRAYCP